MNKNIKLSTGSIRQIMFTHIKPKNPLVVQILETKIHKCDDHIYYDLYVSDGDLGMILSNTQQFNKYNSTGQLSVFTVIVIEKYDFQFDSSSSYSSDIFSFKILANGRDVQKIIGTPTNLPIEMRNWLSSFTTRLEKEAILEKQAALQLNCLNSATNISKLTTGCLQKICYGTKIEKPIVQVLSLVKIINAEENLIYYSVDVSDGRNCFHRVETQSFHFNNLVEAGYITRFSIIRLDKYKLFECASRIKISNVTVVNKNVESQIGDELVPVKLRILDYRLRDKLLKDMKMSCNKKETLLDAASLVDIQRGVSFSEPVLQIVKFHQYSPSLCFLELSDGAFKIHTEFLDKAFSERLKTLKYLNNSIIKIQKYELSFVRDTYEHYKPIIHIKKIEFLTNPEQRYKGLFGEPNFTDIEIPIIRKDYEDSDPVPSTSTAKPNSLQEKPFLKKGFLCTPKTETPKEADSKKSSEKPLSQLTKDVCDLNISINGQRVNEADIRKALEFLEIENAKVEKKMANKKKAASIKFQKLIENNLEIIGIQQTPNEDLKQILDKIFIVLSVSLNIDIDVFVSRIGSTILLKCKNTATKKIILDKMRETQLSTDDLYLDVSKRSIFINEQLTPLNKMLFLKAKALRSEGVFDYVCVKNGQILVKSESHGKKAVHIYSMEQFKEYSS